MRLSPLRICLVVAVGLCARIGYGQCQLLDKQHDILFVTFERPIQFSVDNIEKPLDGVLLRLHNNSSCDIEVEAGTADSFHKPIPTSPTWQQAIHREIDYTLPDGAHVPQLNYTIPSQRGDIHAPGGDVKFEFLLLSRRSLVFAIPLQDFAQSINNGRIDIPFEYSSQKDHSSYPSIRHVVEFYFGELPENVQRKQVKFFPIVWFAPIIDPNKPDWEILPQAAKPGEVILSKRNELGILSNFAATPFEMDGKRYASVEGFWQMMLYPEGLDDERAKAKGVEWKYTREQVAQMTAFDAKAAGTLAEENMKKLGISWVTYQGKKLPYRSSTPGEHYRLIVAAMRAKLEQNPEVKRILLATGDLILKPDHIQETNAPTEWKYNEIWMQLRSEIRK